MSTPYVLYELFKISFKGKWKALRDICRLHVGFRQRVRRFLTRTMASFYDLAGVLLPSFGINLIPFAGPSNLLIAADAALIVKAEPWTIGFLVAVGSASAKLIHYVVTFYAGRFVSEKCRKILNAESMRIKGERVGYIMRLMS